MNDNGTANKYGIAVRQFRQQILPGGIWNTLNGRSDALPATTIWSYGPQTDPVPDSSGLGGGAGIAPAPNSQFNYPSYTIETNSGTPVNVRWVNGLVDNTGNYLPHLLPIDQTLHWANPAATGCVMGLPNRTDCATDCAALYTGPVPIITHVHGAHVDPHSDGFPQAWFLPAAVNIPAGYSMRGSMFDDATGTNPGNLGYAEFRYRNDNPAATLWYHDHALGMTRSNVYAGPAGFWIVRGGSFDGAADSVGGGAATLPGPAPAAGQTVLQLNVPGDPVRNSIREIPIAIQDRSFNADGSLFYPDSRFFFDGYPGPYTGSSPISTDIAPHQNPEFFGNVIVVNGVAWPKLDVAPALYRFRLLDGCNSRMLNLVLKNMTDNTELPFYQIGAEQGFLPKVVQIKTGYATPLPGNGTIPAAVPNPGGPDQALLMGLAERADVIVDFRGLANGTRIRMINTGGDSPFGGFPVAPPADDNTTGQVMEFAVDNTLLQLSDADTTPPQNLVMNNEPALGPATITRQVSLNELDSGQVCVSIAPDGTITVLQPVIPVPISPAVLGPFCAALGGIPMGPTQTRLGKVDLSNPALPGNVPLKWEDASGTSVPRQVTMADNVTKNTVYVTENPRIFGGVAPIEQWEIYNFTVDGHPVHLHLVEFQVVSRAPVPGVFPAPVPVGVQATEAGYKDTVIAYPGEITTVKARFDIPGLYVWHCHIVEHEDNEMMRPYVVSSVGLFKKGQVDYDGDGRTDLSVWRPSTGQWWVARSSDNAVAGFAWGSPTDIPAPGDYDGDGKTDFAIWRSSTGEWWVAQSSDNTTVNFPWGAASDAIVPGDYDGDGKTDFAIWRPSTGHWWIYRSSDGKVATLAFGSPTDIPAPGDYDGDGKADYAIWRPSNGQWWIHRSSDNAVTSFAWGSPTDVPVPGDYDGDGKADYAIWRPSAAQYWIHRSLDNTDVTVALGSPTDVPVPGDYDGDGIADCAVWTPSTGAWTIKLSSNGGMISGFWGSPTDVPIRSR